MKTYQKKGNDLLLITNHKTSHKVLIDNVMFLKGNINYSIVYLENGRTKILSHTLKFYEEFLRTHGFLRIHRAFLINPNYVVEYCVEKEMLKMRNGHEVNISRRRKEAMKDFELLKY